MTEQLRLAPVPASIDNLADWDRLAQQILRGTGLPLTVDAGAVLEMIRSTVPMMFEAQSTSNANLLRGTFADPVIAQCLRNQAALLSGQPASAIVHLVGSRVVDGRAVLRVHVVIQGQSASGEETVDRQFWDLTFGAQVTIGASTCPNCGAPVARGELVCEHCQADVRSTAEAPIVVSRLELY